MALEFVSEPLHPLTGSFDPQMMATGQPGLPERFRWRQQEIIISGVLEHWKEYGDCRHGSGERYVRKHGFRIQTTDGRIARIYFQRSYGKSRGPSARWWLHSFEANSTAATRTEA